LWHLLVLRLESGKTSDSERDGMLPRDDRGVGSETETGVGPMSRLRELLQYTKEALGVLGEMLSGMITSAEAGAQIDQLRRKYGLRDTE
jgi:hypothetical protein